ncbi:MAG: CHRD domain-containing protein [Acidobacteriota bacterium]
MSAKTGYRKDLAVKTTLPSLTVFALVLGTLPVFGQSFTATLAGSREAGGTGDPDGTGIAVLTLDGTTAYYYFWVKDVDPPTAARIYGGRPGESGSVVVDFSPSFQAVGSSAYISLGNVTVSGATAQAISEDPFSFYLDVATAAFPGGALRGQVLGDGPAATAFSSSLRGGSREVPIAGDPDGSGIAVAVLDRSTVDYYLWVKNISTPTAAHMYKGGAGQTGDAVVDFAPAFSGPQAAGSVVADPGVVSDILAHPDEYYINVHTSEFPGGAVRGQLAPTSTTLFFPVLAHNPGAGGSFFRSNLRVMNVNDEDAPVYFEWFPKGSSGAAGPAAKAIEVVTGGGEAVLDDAVNLLFSAADRGSVAVMSSFPIRAVADTFNDQRPAGKGTYGQYMEGLGIDRAYPSGVLVLNSNRPQADLAGFRTNLGYFNPNPFDVKVAFNVRRPDGSLIGTPILSTFRPYANDLALYHQILGGVPSSEQTQENFIITYTASAPVFIYSSVVDNVTSDALNQPSQPIPSASVQAAVAGPTPTPTPSPTPGPTATATPTPIPPAAYTFSEIQGQIFTPICSACHPPNRNMNLQVGVAYSNIVNVSSVENPALMRIKPGDPDNSYMYLKLIGDPRILGSRMPLGGPFLTADQLARFRGWILAGAPEN